MCTIDPDEPGFVKQQCVSFLDSTMLDLEISRIDDISTGRVVSKLKKEDLARMLCSSLCYLNKLTCLNTDYTRSTHSVTVELLEAQKKIIDLQSELIQCKEEKMEAMKTVFHSSVAESVKEEFKSYSSVVKRYPGVTRQRNRSVKRP